MGNCKDELTPTKDPKDSKLGFFPKRKKDVELEPKKFADMLLKSGEILDQLIDEKEKDLIKEKGQEDKNKMKLSILKAMRFHLESVGDLAQEYHEI
jgi:hypothetical protein